MDVAQLDAQPRQVLGKKVNRLRRQGLTPVHLYGKGTDPLSLQMDTQALQRVLVQVGRTSPVTVRVNGTDHFAFVRELQRHPVTGQLLHVDFLQVPLTERLRSAVPIHLLGEAPAVRMQGGSLLQTLHQLEVESLPAEVPSSVELDVSPLDDFEKAIHVSDIDLGPSVTVLTDPETVVARVQPPRAEEKVEKVAAPEEGAAAVREGEQGVEEETA